MRRKKVLLIISVALTVSLLVMFFLLFWGMRNESPLQLEKNNESSEASSMPVSLSFPCPIANCRDAESIDEVEVQSAAAIGFKDINQGAELYTIMNGNVKRFSPILNNENQSKFVIHDPDVGIRVTYLFTGDQSEGLQTDMSIQSGKVIGKIISSDRSLYDLEVYIEVPQGGEFHITPSEDGKQLILNNANE